jgi:hypothetical protein
LFALWLRKGNHLVIEIIWSLSGFLWFLVNTLMKKKRRGGVSEKKELELPGAEQDG